MLGSVFIKCLSWNRETCNVLPVTYRMHVQDLVTRVKSAFGWCKSDGAGREGIWKCSQKLMPHEVHSKHNAKNQGCDNQMRSQASR